MSDFTVVRPFTYVADTLVDQGQANPNENTVYGAHNAAFNATSGHKHTGTTGDAPKLGPTSIDLTANYNWTGLHTWTQSLTVFDGSSLSFYSTPDTSTLTVSITGSNGASQFLGTMGIGPIGSPKITLAGSSGNVSIGGTLIVTGTASIGGALNMNSHQINFVADPSAGTDALNLGYADGRYDVIGAAATAQANAEAFATAADTVVLSSAESFATSAANTAQSNAETYTNGYAVPLSDLPLSTNHGGTGVSSAWSGGGVIQSNGASQFVESAVGLSGQILSSTGVPGGATWVNFAHPLSTFITFTPTLGSAAQQTGNIKFYYFSGTTTAAGNVQVTLPASLVIIGVKFIKTNSPIDDFNYDSVQANTFTYNQTTGIFDYNASVAVTIDYNIMIMALA